MFGSAWQKWLSRLTRPTRPIRKTKSGRLTDLRVESLEDRVTPAMNVTITNTLGPNPLDAFLADGVLTTAEGGAADGTISRTTLESLGGSINISVAALGSITFAHGGPLPLTLQTAAGKTASFSALGGSVSVNALSDLATSGGGLSFSGSNGVTIAGGIQITTSGGNYTANADGDANNSGTYSQGAGSLVATGGGTATVTATDVVLDGKINSVTGTTTIQNSFPGRAIDLGTNTAGTIGLTAAEVNNVTAGLVRIGGATAGTISVSAPVAPTGTNTLALVNNANVNQAGSLAVTNLRVSSGGLVTLVGNNTVGTLAGSAASGFAFNNGANTLFIGAVDGASGLQTTNGDVTLTADNLELLTPVNAGAKMVILQPSSTAQVIGLGAADVVGTTLGLSDVELGRVTAGTLQVGSAANLGGIVVSAPVTRHVGYGTLALSTGNPSATAVSQSSALSVANLAISSQGTVVLTNPSNDVDTIAVQTVGAGDDVSYTDANVLVIGTVAGLSGVATTGGTVTLSAGTTTQTAAANVSGFDLVLQGNGPFTLTNVGNNTANLSATVTGAVSYTDADSLALITGITTTNNPIAIQTVNGNLTNSTTVNAGAAAVTLTAGGTDSLLDNTIGVVQNSGGNTLDLRADRMVLGAAANGIVAGGAGTVILQPTSLNRTVSLDNTPGDPAGELRLSSAELGTVTTAGVLRVGRTDNLGTLFVNSPIAAPVSWNTLSLQTGGSLVQAGIAPLQVTNLAVRAGTAAFPAGNVVANLAANVTGTGASALAFTDFASLTVGPTIDGLTGVTAANGGVNLQAAIPGTNLTVNAPIAAGGTGAGGAVQLAFDSMAINAAVSAVSSVTLAPFSVAQVIDLGGVDVGGKLGLTDVELDRVTVSGPGGVLRIGSALNTGGVTVTAPITQAGSGYNFLSLRTLGSITATAGANGITAGSLALQAGTGIGTPGIALPTNASNLNFTNTVSGVVNVRNVGGVTVKSLDGIGAANNTGTTTTLVTQGGPVTFEVGLTSVGAVTVTAGDTGAVGDNVTVNSGQTIGTSGAANVTLQAGDDVVLQSGSAVNAGGSVTLAAGFGDSGDGKGALVLQGSITAGAGTTIALSAIQDVTLGGASINVGGAGTINVTTTQGAIIDGNDPPTGTTNLTAATINLTAARGIGTGPSADAPLEVTATTLGATNSVSGDVQVVNTTGPVTVFGNNLGGGAFTVTALGSGSLLTVLGGAGKNVTTNNGPVNLTADDINIPVGATVNAGLGTVSIAPVTAARQIDLGTAGGGTILGLSDGELDRVTAGLVRVGTPSNTGGITVTALISASTYPILSLRTDGSISQIPGAPVIGLTAIALQSKTGVNMGVTGNVAGTVAATATAGGAPVTFFATGNLQIGTVDGLSGVTANAAAIDVESFGAGTLTVTNTPLTDDVASSGGNITLAARGAGGLTVNPGVHITSGGGAIDLLADDMTLGSPAGSINAGVGRTTVKPVTPGGQINLGLVGPGGGLALSPAELLTLTAGTVQVGDQFSGLITVSDAVALSGTSVLALQTGGGVTATGPGAITVPNLVVRAAGPVNLALNPSSIGTLAAQLGTTGQAFQLGDAGGLTIGTVDGLSGVTTKDAAIGITTTGDLVVNANVGAGIGSIALTSGAADKTITNNATISNAGGSPITLTADRMNLGIGTITAAGGGTVTLAPFSAGRQINLGPTTDAAPNTLELSNAELNTVATTGALRVGSPTAGNLTVSAPLAISASSLGLINGAAITETGTISAPALRVSSAGPVTLGGANNVGVLAATVSGANAAFLFNNAGSLQIGNVDTVTGISTNNGAITVTTAIGDLVVNNNVVAGTGAVTLTAGGVESLLTVNPFQVAGGSATLTADRMAIAGGVDVGTGATNIVTLLPFTAGRPVNLGVVGDPAGALSLSDAELDLIRAGIVRVGNTNTGTITVSGPITQGTGYATLAMTSGSTISSTGTGSLGVTNVGANGAGGVNLTATPNNITNLAGTTAGNPFSFTNAADLFVATVDGKVGIATAGGAVDLKVTGAGKLLTVSNKIDAGNASVTLAADDMDIQAAVLAGTQTVALLPVNFPRVVSLGNNTPGTLGLVDGELDRITAGLVRIGTAANGGNVSLSGAITQAGSNYNTLSLVTGGAIVDGTAAEATDLTVTNLALSAATGIGSADDLDVAATNLAAVNPTSGNIQISNTGAVTIPGTAIDGVTGVTTSGPGNIALAASGGAFTVAGPVLASGGGNVSVTTSGAGGAISTTGNGTVAARGGNGNVTLDATAATSGGSILINSSPFPIDVEAAGTGNITIRANDGVTIAPIAVIQSGLEASGGGTILIESNATDPAGTADITIGTLAQVLTRGSIILNADPDGNGAGGTIVMGAGISLGTPDGNPADTISLTAATDLVLSDLRAVTSVTARSTAGSLRDDGVDTTLLQAPTISLTAARALGGPTAMTAADVTGTTAAFLGAIDYDGTLTFSQTGLGGNVQLRRVNSGITTSTFAGFTPVGAGSQLALIATGGALTVDAAVNLSANLLLGATGNPVNVNFGVTNTGPTTLVAAGSAVNVNAPVSSGGNLNVTSTGTAGGDGALVNANLTTTGAGATVTVDANRDIVIAGTLTKVSTPAGGGAIAMTAGRGGTGVLSMASDATVTTAANNSAITMNSGTGAGTGGDITLATVTAGTGPVNAGPVNVRSFAGSILDGNGAGTANVTGGAIALQSDGATGINLDVVTATPATAGVTATTSNDPITLRSQGQLQVTNVNAGATGDVTLNVGDGATTGIVTSLTPNDGTADITGRNVTIAATGPTNGNTGQIGFFNAGGQFLEVTSAKLTATTNNSRLWVASIGSSQVASVTAGTNTAFLRANGGTVTSATVDGNPDVTAATVNLSNLNGGSFGISAGNPLEIDATSLTATLAGTGGLSVRDTTGGLSVTNAQTAGQPINLQAAGAGANLTLAQVNAGAGSATLTATGAVNGTPGGTADVTAGTAAITAGTGIGTGTLETAVSSLSATTTAGNVAVANTGSLTINGMAANAGTVTVTTTGSTAAGAMTVAGNVQAAGNITLTAADTFFAGDDLVVNSGVTIISTAGNPTLRAGDVVNLGVGGTVSAPVGTVTLNGGFSDLSNGGGVTFLGTTASDVSILGGPGVDTFTINPTSTSPVVPIDGLGGADVFNITPKTASAFNVVGGAPAPVGAPPPAALPGDSLGVVLVGVPNPVLTANFVAGAGYSGSWTFGGGFQPVNFNTIETLTPTADLAVAISDGVTNAVPGTTVVYTLTVGNSGPSTATGATLSVPLPAAILGASFTSVATPGATGNTPSGSGSLNETLTLAPGSSVTYTITATVNPAATGSLSTTATLTTPATSPDLGGFVKSATDTDTLTPLADVTVTTTQVGADPSPGGRISYAITVQNNGPSTATSVTFTDTLPAGTTFFSITQTGGPAFALTSPSPGGSGAVAGSIASFAPGAVSTFLLTVRATAPAGTPLTNTVTVSSATPDPNPANQGSTTATTVTPLAVNPRVIAATASGAPPAVNVYDATNGGLLSSFNPFDATFAGGVNVAQGDVNGDGVPDVIIGTGSGGSPLIKVYDGKSFELIRTFFAYSDQFRGGVNVAAGDVNGDGFADIIAGTGVGGSPHIRVFDGATGGSIASFFAYDQNFRGGVLAGSGDVNGDGFADVVAGSGVGGGPNARVYDGRTFQLIRSFFAYDSTFRNGVQVAVGDVDADGFADIITGSGPGGGPNVKVFSGLTTALISSFFGFPPVGLTGVYVGSTDANADGRADVTVGSGVGLPPEVRIYDALSQAQIASLDVFNLGESQGVYVG